MQTMLRAMASTSLRQVIVISITPHLYYYFFPLGDFPLPSVRPSVRISLPLKFALRCNAFSCFLEL
jgi:hypothetical protein